MDEISLLNLFLQIRCQELSEEVSELNKERMEMEAKISVASETSSKAQLLDDKLAEKVKRIGDLEMVSTWEPIKYLSFPLLCALCIATLTLYTPLI